MPRLDVTAQHTPAELRHLARHEDNRRARMRLIGIAETIDGADRKTAAARADMSDQALRDAIKRYNREGVAGLHDKPHTGRPPKLDAVKCEQLCAIVREGPDVETEGLSAYTRDDAAKIAKEKWNVDYHVTSIGRILRAGGLSRQKARPSHPKKDQEAVEAFKKGLRTSF